MKRLLLILMLAAISFGTHAQYYKHSAGMRAGVNSALTYKHFYNDEQAFEVMLGGRNEGMHVTWLYLFHKPLNNVFSDMIYFYYGVGAHVGYESYATQDSINTLNDLIDNQSAFLTMGIDATVGIEYRMLAVPITIGLEVKPYVQFVDMRYGDTNFWDVGASVKYVF